MPFGCWRLARRQDTRLNTIWGLAAGRYSDGGSSLPPRGKGGFPGRGSPALRKENKELREERDILRKAMAIFSRPPR